MNGLININHAYAFIGGAFVGRFTGIVPSILISGLLLYMVDSSLFTHDNLINIKNITVNLFK